VAGGEKKKLLEIVVEMKGHNGGGRRLRYV
jgi:hypothetical protein